MKLFSSIFIASGFAVKRVFQLIQIRVEKFYYESRNARSIVKEKQSATK